MIIKRVRNGLIVLALLFAWGALFGPAAAHAAMPSADGMVSSVASRQIHAVSSTATIVTYAQRGEGVIRITTRVCGNAANWKAVAAANGIKAPVYLVLLGQRIAVTCAPGSASSASSSGKSSSTPPASSSGWFRPVSPGCISSPFGVPRPGHIHAGDDLRASYGTPIHAIAAGTVTVGYQAGGAGYWTAINHGGGVWSVYMHQSRYAVRSGWVAAGQVIGYVGATGNAQGPHLHFEIHTAGLWHGKVDPAVFMRNHGVTLGNC